MPDRFNLVTVAVDPPAKVTGDECGITVQGRVNHYTAHTDDPMSKLPHGFVLADYSKHGTPGEWASRCLEAYHDWNANYFVAEINNGGDMVAHTIHTIDPFVQVKVKHATKGKAKRAEPVVGVYEQGRYHHVGYFPLLEDQMTSWDADDPPDDWSPDRMDALVWGAHDMAIGRPIVSQGKSRDERLKGRR